jgi:tetratricopeptide (TPR) repeat protein
MLRPKKHITRQKLKEDKFITRTLQVFNWIKRRQRELIIGLVAVVVVFLAWNGLRSAGRAAEREASLLLLQAGYAQDEGRTDVAREHLEFALDHYGRSRSGGRAAFLLAGNYFQSGAIDSAEATYKLYLRKNTKDPLLTAAARAGLAACRESRGEYEPAARAWQEAGAAYRNDATTPQYYMEAARCFRLAGRIPEALALYDRIQNEFPGRAEADRASIERAILARTGGEPNG